MKTADKILIERYLDNTLSGGELQDFLHRLDNDEDFRRMVSTHNLLIESIQLAEDTRLETSLEKALNYRKSRIPSSLKLIGVFLVITFSGIFLWEYIGNAPVDMHKYAVFNFFKKNKDKPPHAKETVSNPVKAQLSDTTEQEEEAKEPPVELSESAATVDTTSSGQEVVIKKDQMLVSFTLTVADLDAKSGNESSLAQSATDKLNPAAGLAESKSTSENTVEVEFWVSPINYKGYKFSTGKLILFGIEEPDAVKLYTSEKQMVMKYGKEFFQLIPSGDFLSFTQIKDSELPAALR